jgi:hypothetical protein
MLHEQQLGLEWTSPDLFLLNREDLASYRSAMQVVSDLFPKIGEGKSGVFAVIRTIVVILLCFPLILLAFCLFLQLTMRLNVSLNV